MVTGDAMEDSSRFCFISNAVNEQILYARAPCCARCGHPFYGEIEWGALCANCREQQAYFQAGKTLFLARGAGRTIIHQLKYNNARYLLDDMVTMLKHDRSYSQFLENSILVPVPLHPIRERKRGYNQARLIADVFARNICGATVVPVLKRIQDTASQTQLSRQKRIANVKNAFAWDACKELSCERRHVLIDDVFTTGSTLNACAMVLNHWGIKHIDIATLAHG